jgi:hypothetical protein
MLIPAHPFDGWTVTLPKRDRAARDIWEEQRVNAVLAGFSDPHRPIPLLSATCGHRQGESFAVALQDVNRFRREITIRHQVKVVNGERVLTPPKSGKVRTAPAWIAELHPQCRIRGTGSVSSSTTLYRRHVTESRQHWGWTSMIPFSFRSCYLPARTCWLVFCISANTSSLRWPAK